MSHSNIQDSMSPIVRTVCGWIAGFILLYGIQVVLYGHLTPGGGFSGGVIAASAFVLILLAEGEDAATKTFSRKAASMLDSLGVLLFWLMPILGILVAGMFFVNFWITPPESQLSLWSSGIIPVCNVGIGLKVCSSLYLVVLVLTAVAHDQIVKKKGDAS